MKSFKSFVAEVAQPEAEEEKRFKAQHTVDKLNHPHAEDGQFTGEIKGKPGKAKRIADQDSDTDYDKAYKVDAEKRMVPESVEEELSPKQKKIDLNKNGKIDGHDLAMLRSKKKNEEAESVEENWATKAMMGKSPLKKKYRAPTEDEKRRDQHKNMMKKQYGSMMGGLKKEYGESVELDELSKATLGSYIKKASDDQADSGYERGRNSADSDRSKKAIDKYIKRRSGINKAVKRLTKESVEDMQEAVKFKKGPVRLDDGSQVMVSAQDASLLNQMFKDLSPRNQKEMSKVAMMDKAGWQEILGFAREAL